MNYRRKTRDCWRFYLNYGQGWEHEITEFTRAEMKENRRAYQANCNYPLRIVKGREPIAEVVNEETKGRNDMVSTPINVNEVFAALEVWIKQRPGLDWRDYGTDTADGRRAYQQEIRDIGKDKTRALKALDEARGLHPQQPELLADAFRAFSGRLQWAVTTTNGAREACGDCGVKPGYRHADGCNGGLHDIAGKLEYCTGQYWPTEYRKAAAAVIEHYIAAWRKHENANAPKTFTYHTMADVKAANQAIGNSWFDRSTMRFFNTKIESGLIAGKYFITSERCDENHPRLYTVRLAAPDGSVDTVGEFQDHLTREDARQAINTALIVLEVSK